MISYFNSYINDIEFSTLYDLKKSTNMDFPYDSYDHFNFGVFDNEECLAELDFENNWDIPLLAEVLQVPDVMTC